MHDTNADGIQMLRSIESQSYNAARLSSEEITKTTSLFPMNTTGTSSAVADRGTPVAPNAGLPNGDNCILEDVKPRIVDESSEKSNTWKLTEINEPSQCCSLKLPDNLLLVKNLWLCKKDGHYRYIWQSLRLEIIGKKQQNFRLRNIRWHPVLPRPISSQCILLFLKRNLEHILRCLLKMGSMLKLLSNA